MAKEFVRKIRNIGNIDTVRGYTNDKGDLLIETSDKEYGEHVYVRIAGAYKPITFPAVDHSTRNMVNLESNRLGSNFEMKMGPDDPNNGDYKIDLMSGTLMSTKNIGDTRTNETLSPSTYNADVNVGQSKSQKTTMLSPYTSSESLRTGGSTVNATTNEMDDGNGSASFMLTRPEGNINTTVDSKLGTSVMMRYEDANAGVYLDKASSSLSLAADEDNQVNLVSNADDGNASATMSGKKEASTGLHVGDDSFTLRLTDDGVLHVEGSEKAITAFNDFIAQTFVRRSDYNSQIQQLEGRIQALENK